MSKSSSKYISIVLWVLLIALLGIVAFTNLISVFFYSRNLSLFLLGIGFVLILLKYVNKKCIHQDVAKSQKSFLVEFVLPPLFCLLFLLNGIVPRYRIGQIAKEAGLDLPSFTRIHYFQEDIGGFSGTEDPFNITISFSKKHVIPFTQPFWSENEKESTLAQLPQSSEYLLYGYRESEEAHLGFRRFIGRDFNVSNKHWVAKKLPQGCYMELFLDLEKENTATAYMDITIY